MRSDHDRFASNVQNNSDDQWELSESRKSAVCATSSGVPTPAVGTSRNDLSRPRVCELSGNGGGNRHRLHSAPALQGGVRNFFRRPFDLGYFGAVGLNIEQFTRAMDDLDRRIRVALPIVANVFIDVTANGAECDSSEPPS